MSNDMKDEISVVNLKIGDFITFKNRALVSENMLCITHMHDGVVYGENENGCDIACFRDEVLANHGQ